MTRIGRVSQIDYDAGKIKVTFQERDEPVSNWIGMQSYEYDPPEVGDLVAVDLDGGDYTEGVEIGGYYNAENVPDPAGPTVCHKKFGKDLILKYDKAAKELEITAATKIKIISADIELTGNVTITGDVKITGNVDLTGDMNVTGNVNVSGTVKAAAVVEGG